MASANIMIILKFPYENLLPVLIEKIPMPAPFATRKFPSIQNFLGYTVLSPIPLALTVHKLALIDTDSLALLRNKFFAMPRP